MRYRPVRIEKIAVLRAMRPGFATVGLVSAAIGALLYAGRGTSPRHFHAMANIHSQKKRILRSERERLENRRYTSTIKTYFRRLIASVEAKDDAKADADHRELLSLIDKAVKTGALHRNNGARKKSRAARIRAGASS